MNLVSKGSGNTRKASGISAAFEPAATEAEAEVDAEAEAPAPPIVPPIVPALEVEVATEPAEGATALTVPGSGTAPEGEADEENGAEEERVSPSGVSDDANASLGGAATAASTFFIGRAGMAVVMVAPEDNEAYRPKPAGEGTFSPSARALSRAVCAVGVGSTYGETPGKG